MEKKDEAPKPAPTLDRVRPVPGAESLSISYGTQPPRVTLDKDRPLTGAPPKPTA